MTIEEILKFTLITIGIGLFLVIFTIIYVYGQNYNCYPERIEIESIEHIINDDFLDKNNVKIIYTNYTDRHYIDLYHKKGIEDVKAKYSYNTTYIINWCPTSNGRTIKGIIQDDWSTRLFYWTTGKEV